MKRLRPVMLIGLGESGTNAAGVIHNALVGRGGELESITSRISLLSDQLIDHGTLAVLPLTELDAEMSDGVFARNYASLLANVDRLEPWLAERLVALLRQDVRLALEERGHLVDAAVTVILLTSLADPIGSASLVPLLAALQGLLAGRMRGSAVETHVVGLFPDVFAKERDNQEAYARAYTCLQELEYVAEAPAVTGVLDQPPYVSAFVFSSRNEDGIEASGTEHLLQTIGEFLAPFLRRDFGSDTSYSVALARQVEEKTTRYSSFGLSRLVFPVEHVMKAIAAHHCASIVTRFLGPVRQTFHIDAISGVVTEFTGETQLDRLVPSAHVTDSGSKIFSEFRYAGGADESTSVEQYIGELEVEAAEYVRTVAPGISQAVASRRDSLLKQHLNALRGKLTTTIDDATRGAYHALAFVDVLLDLPSDHTREEGTVEHHSIAAVEAQAKTFFDKQYGIDREGLSRINRDLTDKRALLERIDTRPLGSDGSDTAGAVPFAGPAEPPRKTIKELKAQIKELHAQRVARASEIAEFDARLADAAHRRGMLQELRERAAAERDDLFRLLMTVEADLQRLRSRLDDLYVQRRRQVLNLALVFPLLLGLLFASSMFAVAEILEIEWAEAMGRYANYGIVLMLAYSVFGIARYLMRIAPAIRNARLDVAKKRSSKRQQMWALEQSYAKSFRADFEHQLHGGLIQWVAAYKIAARELGQHLREFIGALEESRGDAQRTVGEMAFVNTPLTRSAVSPDDVRELIESNPRATHEEESFRRAHVLSTFFAAYEANGDLRQLKSAISQFAEEVYADVRSQSIDQVLVSVTGSENRLLTKLSQLYESSKAFIHLDVDRGTDVSQALVYVGTQTDDPSTCRQLFSRIGDASTTFYSTGERHELTAARLKVGFPAFHIALVRHGRRVVREGDPARLMVDPEWTLPDLMPSLITVGSAEDPARTLFCLGRAFGLIEHRVERGFTFEGALMGTSVEEGVSALRKTANSKMRVALTNKVASAKAEEHALNRLLSARDALPLDAIDREIVTRLIAEIDPIA